MSYLNPVRLHFAGTFQADPSTINNVATNFNPKVPSDKLRDLWNPDGTGNFDFVDVKVTRACYADGSSTTDAGQDPIIGKPLRGTNNPFPGKIVDLDTEQQMVSELWGFELMVGELPSSDSVTGHYRVAAFNDIWGRQSGTEGGDMAYSAYYQSVLENLAWAASLDSRVLKELSAAAGGRLSIKFNVDLYNPANPAQGHPPVNANGYAFTHGRVVGTIGPADAAEPVHFVAGRLLRPSIETTSFAQFSVADGKAYIDLGNSLTTDAKGALIDQGPIQLCAGSDTIGQPVTDYAGGDWYPQTAGVIEVDLGGRDVSTTPLSLTFGGTRALAENSAGAYLRADQFVFRLNPAESAEVKFMALTFGQPAAGVTIDLDYNDSLFQPTPGISVGSPTSALPLPASPTTGDDGWATATLTAGDPGNPRGFIDGQIYGVGYGWRGAVHDYAPDPSNVVSVRVFDGVAPAILEMPTWENLIGPVFTQYDRLYPIMKNVGMGEYASVKRNAQMIWNAISLPMDKPQHMPATRDLSRDKVQAFKTWMDAGCPEK